MRQTCSPRLSSALIPGLPIATKRRLLLRVMQRRTRAGIPTPPLHFHSPNNVCIEERKKAASRRCRVGDNQKTKKQKQDKSNKIPGLEARRSGGARISAGHLRMSNLRRSVVRATVSFYFSFLHGITSGAAGRSRTHDLVLGLQSAAELPRLVQTRKVGGFGHPCVIVARVEFSDTTNKQEIFGFPIGVPVK